MAKMVPEEIKHYYKALSSDVSIVDGERAVLARISTIAVDRDRDVLVPQGCNSKDYQLNPVVMYYHAWADWSAELVDKLPVAQCTAINREETAVMAKLVFAKRPDTHPADECWLPDTLFSLYQQGVMRAFSVGFTPIESREATDRDLEKYGADCRHVITKWKLFEISCVTLPANQEAVALAVSKGKIPDAMKRMFGKDGLRLPEPVAPANKDVKKINCSGCKKDFPAEEIVAQDDAPSLCLTCVAEKKKEGAAPIPEGAKRVVAEVPASDSDVPPSDALPVKRVHVMIDDEAGTEQKENPEGRLVRVVQEQISKARGRIYAK